MKEPSILDCRITGNECDPKGTAQCLYNKNQKGYRCTCPNGMTGLPLCLTDINECTDPNFPHQCGPNTFCQNTNFSYTCECKPGFRPTKSDKYSCQDINECFTSNNLCEHKCVNTVGSYKCVCREGYELDLISGRCKDVNECELGTHDCDQKCVNTAGSYYCRCDEGFTKGKDLKLGLGV